MPQIFQVLRCFQCAVFQVHHTKKINKWECKLCGVKQSIKRHYGLGTGKECRIHVQKLNGVRGEIDESNVSTDDKFDDESGDNNKLNNSDCDLTRKESKWSGFVETEEITESACNQTMYLDNTEVVLEIPNKRKKSGATNISKIKCEFVTQIQKKEAITDNFYKEKKIEVNNKNEFSNTGLNVPNFLENTIMSDLKPDSNENRKDKCSNLKNCEPQINSKWDQFTDLAKTSRKEENIKNKPQNNSKWVQFTDMSEVKGKKVDSSTNIENTIQKIPNYLFSLCHDNELDDVLKI